MECRVGILFLIKITSSDFVQQRAEPISISHSFTSHVNLPNDIAVSTVVVGMQAATQIVLSLW